MTTNRCGSDLNAATLVMTSTRQPMQQNSDWVEACYPIRRLSLSTVVHAVRKHEVQIGNRIDVGFLPKLCGSCHVVGECSEVLKAVGAVCGEEPGLRPDGWRFTMYPRTLAGMESTSRIERIELRAE